MNISELNKLYNRFCCHCDETVMYDQFLVVERAEGLHVWFKGEKDPYLDLVMGYSATNFGHKYPQIRKIVEEAIKKIDHIHSFNCEDKILLSKLLAEKVSRDNNRKVYFTVGGAMAVEVAIKLARAYKKKEKIVSFKGGFHGYSLGAIMLTDEKFVKKEQYSPYPGESVILPYANCYRCEYRNDCSFECLKEIEDYLQQDISEIAAMIVEPVQGGAGFIIPPKEFIVGLGNLCEKYNIILIDDEIQVGLGRTGRMFAIEHFNVEPDIILLGKSLAGGYYPLSAIIARSEIFDSISPEGSAIGSTFGNSPVGTHIALRVMQILKKENLLENAERVGDYFTRELKEFEERYECVDNVTGIGLAQSFEIVENKKTKNPDRLRAEMIKSEALKQKVIIYTAGTEHNRIKFTLPLWVTKEDVDMIIEKLHNVFETLSMRGVV